MNGRAAALALLLLVASCKVQNPAFCSTEKPCDEPGSACDVTRHECVAANDGGGCAVSATLDVDFEGDARPQGGRHDMGADEFGP